MKWNKIDNRYNLEGTNIDILFTKISSNIYAKVYIENVLMFSFSNPIKSKSDLKDQIEELYISNLDNVTFNTLKNNKELNNIVWCELNRIRNDVSK